MKIIIYHENENEDENEGKSMLVGYARKSTLTEMVKS